MILQRSRHGTFNISTAISFNIVIENLFAKRHVLYAVDDIKDLPYNITRIILDASAVKFEQSNNVSKTGN